jgi:inosine/xanthosine triphosphatase
MGLIRPVPGDRNVIIAAGTKNPAKLEGIRIAFSQYFPSFELRSVDSSSVARTQPLGLEQMVEGAVARAKFALSREGGDYGVGVEAGIFQVGDLYFDHQQAAVADPSGKVSLGHSAGYALPADSIEKLIKEGKELEQFAEVLSGIHQVGDKGGLVHYLTRGRITRADLTEQCVTMALIPWLHRDVYRF